MTHYESDSVSYAVPMADLRSYAGSMRYVLVNFVAVALFVAAVIQGWISQIYDSDVTRLTSVIAITFLVGLVLCSQAMWRSDRTLNQCRRGDIPVDPTVTGYLEIAHYSDGSSRAVQAETMRMRLFGQISIIRYLANSLVVLGLIGTVIGFIIALSGVDADIAMNPSAVSPMVASLIEGMSVALYTTLVGAVLSVWLGLCFQMLSSTVRELVATTVDRGERVAASASRNRSQ